MHVYIYCILVLLGWPLGYTNAHRHSNLSIFIQRTVFVLRWQKQCTLMYPSTSAINAIVEADASQTVGNAGITVFILHPEQAWPTCSHLSYSGKAIKQHYSCMVFFTCFLQSNTGYSWLIVKGLQEDTKKCNENQKPSPFY